MEYKLVKKRDEDYKKDENNQDDVVSDEIGIELLSNFNISNNNKYQTIPNSSSNIVDNDNTIEVSNHKLSFCFSIISIIFILIIIYQYKIIYKDNIISNSFYATKIAFGSCTAYDLRQMFIWEGIFSTIFHLLCVLCLKTK